MATGISRRIRDTYGRGTVRLGSTQVRSRGRPDPQVLKDRQAQREQRDRLAPRARQEQPAQLARKALPARQGPKAQLDRQVLQARQGQQDRKVILVPQDRLAPQARPDLKDLQVQRDLPGARRGRRKPRLEP